MLFVVLFIFIFCPILLRNTRYDVHERLLVEYLCEGRNGLCTSLRIIGSTTMIFYSGYTNKCSQLIDSHLPQEASENDIS